MADESKSLTPIERVRCALAMAEAGYKTTVDLEEAEALLLAHDRQQTAIRNYLAVFDKCGGSEAVGAHQFAAARDGLRAAIND